MTKITASPTGMIILLFHRFYRIVSPMGIWLDNDSRSGCDFYKNSWSECGLIMIHGVNVA